MVLITNIIDKIYMYIKLLKCEIMKTVKIIVLLLSILTINSCSNKEEIYDENTHVGEDGGYPNYYYHKLILSFQDGLGSDLLKELYNAMDCVYYAQVKPELYTLEIDFEDGIPNPYELYDASMTIWKGERDNFFLELNDDYCYLRFLFIGSRTYYRGMPEEIEKMPFSEKNTLTMCCPYLFGDNAAHEIVTWWKPNDKKALSETICYRIEFGGKEFTEINHA